MAYCILLLVERLMLSPRDVTAVGTGHCALFIPDRSILGVQALGLALCDLTFMNFFVDPLILI